MSSADVLHLFEGFGIELEYMIVDSATLDVKPVADSLLAQVGGRADFDVDMGALAWSNELALHVIELKTNGPSSSLSDLGRVFQEHVGIVEGYLAPLGARLLPSAMHPWMDPRRETHLWPHEHNEVYRTFDRIFDCSGHGWSNLQSMHINLPFADDLEFARLHAAVRVVLPILPALAASSPFVEGRRSQQLDTRVEVYRHNARKVPSVSGAVVPEAIFTPELYRRELLGRIYRDLEPLDPDGVLRHEWVNARGAIARFDRMAIEIRLLDVQECPAADLAVAALVVETVRGLVEERWCSSDAQQSWSVERLKELLQPCIVRAEQAPIVDGEYLALFGYAGASASAGELWHHLIDQATRRHGTAFDEWITPLQTYIRYGTLARRLARKLGAAPTPAALRRTYERLAGCLREGVLFDGDT